MFQRLRKKWNVNGIQLLLILCTFAIGGSITGFAGRRLMDFFLIESKWLWIIVYIILVTLIWPLSVLLVSIPFGQYRFFTGYLKKMGRRMGIGSRQSAIGNEELGTSNQQPVTSNPLTTHHSPLTRMAIFASGAGSNAQKIIDHFRNSTTIKVSLIVCNKPGAGVINIAAKEDIPVLLIEKEKFFRGNAYVDELNARKIDFIVLAGFLWKIPLAIIKAFPGRIINIHPALLPKYGGKGMYGNFVHEAVLNAKEKESGITIHYVDEHYDNGDMIFQVKCEVMENDTPDTLAHRIHKLEHEYYPKVIEQVASQFSMQ